MEEPDYNVISRKDIEFGDEITPTGSRNSVHKAVWTSPEGPQEVAAKNCNKFKEEEVKILAALQHKNIIKFHGVVKLDFPPDAYVIVTEYAEKGSLYKIIDQNRGNWSVYRQAVWLKWAREGAEGLDYIHQRGYQHGDVKSPNFLITNDDTMKICDFGTARKHMYTVTTESVRGSFPWMAPEAMGILHEREAKNPKVTTKSDVFSFAVVLWELLTGQVPFPGQTQLEIYKAVVENKKRLDIPQDCTRPLSNLLKNCWAPDYKQRPSMEEILKFLDGDGDIADIGAPSEDTQEEHQTNASQRTDKVELSDLFFLRISKQISTQWQFLAYVLGFENAEVQTYQANNIGNVVAQCHNMLVDWRRRQENEDDVGKMLKKALGEIGRNDLARLL